MREYLKTAKILLPDIKDYTKWSVVACDQYTGDKTYWEKLKEYVGDEVSTLNLILPEAYLSKDNFADIKRINDNMNIYLKSGIFKEFDGAVLTERTFPSGKKRVGIVACIDLEDYDFKIDSNPLIRATEGTVIERIPPRLKIRENAPLELPHILLLANDEKNEIFKPLYENRNNYEKLYDFELNMNGGHLRGYYLKSLNFVNEILNKNKDKYNTSFIFAVGDGNHSLATAKTMWENIKNASKEENVLNHPARYALIELVNLYDDGLIFEPIHRIVYNADNDILYKEAEKHSSLNGKYQVDFIYEKRKKTLNFDMSVPKIYKTVQKILDGYKNLYKDAKIDYIHGEKELIEITEKNNALGIIMPCMKKDGFFEYIEKNKILPKKTFSMGEANEKRYYTEARKIF